MRKIKLVIPLLPISLNVIKGWMYDDRTKWKYPALVDEWDCAVNIAILTQLSPVDRRLLLKYANIHIKYYFRTRAQRDLDNYAFKPLLDALKGQVIEDDNDKLVKVKWELLVDRNNPRTVIDIIEKPRL